jgi:hypothetical protein
MTGTTHKPGLEKAARRFVLPFLVLLGAAWFCLALGTFFLSRVGELTPVRAVVARQLAGGGLYGEALRDNRRAYKQALYGAIRPDIVAIGSSRTQEFRAEFFNRSFANLSGGILTFDEADSFIDAMLAKHVPKVVIFGVDYWWFDTRRAEASRRMNYDHSSEGDISLADRLVPIRWLLQRKFPAHDMAAALNRTSPDAFGPPQGALAVLDHTGFRADGSWAWLNVAMAAYSNPGLEFLPSPAPPGQPLFDTAKLDHLAALVRKMQARGVRVVLFLPPEMAQAVAVHRDHSQVFPVFAALHDTLARLGAPWFDFDDARSVGGSDCEFIDSVHAGEVLGVRMLRNMAADPTAGLGQLVNGDRIDAAIARWSGHAVIWSEGERAQFRERDFLGMGCPKRLG